MRGRTVVTTLEAQWKREVQYCLGACVVDLARTVEARSLGINASQLPQKMRPLWAELCRQADEGHREIDVPSMRHFLADASGQDADATRQVLADLECEGHGRHVPTHAVRLRETWLKIQLAEVTKGQASALECDLDDGAAYARGLSSAEDIRAELAKLKTPPRKWADVVKEAEKRGLTKSERVVHSTGLQFLDAHLGGGLRPGWLVVVMGAAKSGKTALAVNGLACETATRGGETLVVSLEMGEEEQAARMLARESGVPLRAQANADMTPTQEGWFATAAVRVAKWPMEVVTGLTTADEICNRARVHKRERGLVMLVVDYLQLIDNGNENRVQDLERSTRKLKLLAVEMSCVVVLLSQPNNAAARGGSPGLFDGKGSGSIAADCDAMLVPLRDDKDPGRAGIDLAGCRHAEPKQWPLGSLRFDGGRALFIEPGMAVPGMQAPPQQQALAAQRVGANTL